ncbi:Adenosylmethionine-8-amino-7-oxononanoate aminotransferase [Burkholderia sp. YR290]|uniref:aspartate aminotransferase family protein n=1 Tax=Paraburkholderia hospita TaxID=169430 RepID=UPI0009A7D799|nr:aspartate aminotransferase family protein [Paraburkholderia hospita]SKC92945.1 Adenosylmethionine-8-amino-7-oxononanoate aminotransferase [Paraburkholderia hospita]SOE91007.1 Adenosylmethionine-8-amino-7-oxononanoate aminotransferase [Burkholderia sp. YR290]
MQNLKQNDINHYLHPYTNLSLHREVGPMVIERGEGVYVYDSEGNRYLEGLGGLFCASLGFSETRLADAADRQMRKLPFYHAFGHKSSEPSILLAEKLISMAPVPMSKVFFANSGSEANDTAVKLIWYFNNAIGRPQKKKIISRTRAYHGVTIASASLTGLQNNHRDFDLPIDRILHTDCPHFYRYGLPGESEEQFATRCAESLERLILEEGADTIAAFFAEPVMASGGVIVPPATYMEKVQAVLKRHDILLVADEVICGFGRTGNMFGSQTFGMQPDMITMAKQLSAGYLPISALMVNERIYRGLVTESEKIGTFGHGFTYSGHPVCAAVALETLNIYEQDGILEHVRAVTPHFQERVAELGRHPLVGEARGAGLLAAVELVADKASREPFAPSQGVAAYAGTRALSHGLITRALGDTVNFCPPLIVTRAQIDEMFDAAKRALDDTLAWRKTLNNN